MRLKPFIVRQRLYRALDIEARYLTFFHTWAALENLSFGAATFADIAGCDKSDTGGKQQVRRFLDYYEQSGLNLGAIKRKKGELTVYGLHTVNEAVGWILNELQSDPHPNPIVGCDSLVSLAIDRFSLLPKPASQKKRERGECSSERSCITGDIGWGKKKKRKNYRIGPLLERGEAAIRLAREGFKVAPVYGVRNGVCLCWKGANCKSAGKHWSVVQPQQVASRFEPLIHDLYIRQAHANIGILAGEKLNDGGFLLGLDIDPRNFGPGVLFALERDVGPLPVTREHGTPSGGLHKLFSSPVRLQSKNGMLGRGVDVKCLGGLLVGPGSIGGNGNEYFRKDPAPIAPLPHEWLRRIDAVWKKKAPLIKVGDRHNKLIEWAGGIVGKDGFSGEAAFQILKDRRDKRCEPGPPFITNDALREMIGFCEKKDQLQGQRRDQAA